MNDEGSSAAADGICRCRCGRPIDWPCGKFAVPWLGPYHTDADADGSGHRTTWPTQAVWRGPATNPELRLGIGLAFLALMGTGRGTEDQPGDEGNDDRSASIWVLTISRAASVFAVMSPKPSVENTVIAK